MLPATLWIERFGTKAPELYFTIFNPADTEATALIAPDSNTDKPWDELITGKHLDDLTKAIAVPPRSIRVLRIAP